MLRILLVITLIAGGATVIFLLTMEWTSYATIGQILKNPNKWNEKKIAAQGIVQPGSLTEKIDDQTLKRTFILENEGEEILVRHEGPRPDTFQEGGKIVAKGYLVKTENGYEVQAKELIAKCPSKYEE